MNVLGKGSVEKGFAIPPGKRSRLESVSLAVVITVIKQSTRSWHRHGSRSLELCFWHGARALGGAGQLLWSQEQCAAESPSLRPSGTVQGPSRG